MKIMYAPAGLEGDKRPTIVKDDNGVIVPLMYFQKADGAADADYGAVVAFIAKLLNQMIQKKKV